MSGGHGCVGGENALTPHLLDVFAANRRPARFFRLLPQELQREQGRVPFVHVISRQLVIA